MQSVHVVEEKRRTRKGNGAKSLLKEIKSLKKTLMLNGIKEVVTSGQDPAQLSFQVVKKN